MSLCSNCMNFAKELSTRDRSEYCGSGADIGWQIASDFLVLLNASDPSASAKTCPLCRLFLEDLENLESRRLFNHVPENRSDTVEKIPDGIHAEIRVFGGNWMSDELSLHRLSPRVDRFYGDLRIYATPGNEAARSGHIYGRVPNLHQSPESLSWIQQCLQYCLSNHVACKMTIGGEALDSEPMLPSRVLDLGENAQSQEIRLVEGSECRGHYTSLSYCWGVPGKEPLRTTPENLRQHLSAIAMSKLPRTYRDAISVTRSLGLRYLWIDALCIIQGDEEDWARESQFMGQYYQRARVVIAASGARDPTEGCFLKRPFSQSVVSLPFYRDDIVVGSFHLYKAAPDELRNPECSPLYRRGWAAQEWWLARRIVHFIEGCIVWSCSTNRTSGLANDGSVAFLRKVPDWESMITHYSAGELTYETDKLHAVQGLANELKKSRKDDYIMGLWTGDLPDALLWHRGSQYLKRTEALAAFPSWSWASIRGQVRSVGPQTILEALGSYISMEDEGRRLTIKGHMITGHISEPPGDQVNIYPGPRPMLPGSLGTILGQEGQHLGWAAFDEDSDRQGDIAHCLCLGEKKYYVSEVVHWYCLLLEELDDRRTDDCTSSDRVILTYKRIGVGAIIKGPGVENMEEETVWIV